MENLQMSITEQKSFYLDNANAMKYQWYNMNYVICYDMS